MYLYKFHPSQFVYGRYLKKLSNRTQEALGEMSQVAQESLSALRTVQAFSARKWEENKFSEKVANILDLGKKEAWASGIFYGKLISLSFP
jgi:ATP-binding cassette, subfamily B (MDR/TAP), member 10